MMSVRIVSKFTITKSKNQMRTRNNKQVRELQCIFALKIRD